jgi:hypothetical protein
MPSSLPRYTFRRVIRANLRLMRQTMCTTLNDCGRRILRSSERRPRASIRRDVGTIANVPHPGIKQSFRLRSDVLRYVVKGGCQCGPVPSPCLRHAVQPVLDLTIVVHDRCVSHPHLLCPNNVRGGLRRRIVRKTRGVGITPGIQPFNFTSGMGQKNCREPDAEFHLFGCHCCESRW